MVGLVGTGGRLELRAGRGRVGGWGGGQGGAGWGVGGLTGRVGVGLRPGCGGWARWVGGWAGMGRFIQPERVYVTAE